MAQAPAAATAQVTMCSLTHLLLLSYRWIQGPGTWMLYQDQEGRPYYYNAQTQQTQWEEPAGFKVGAIMTPRPSSHLGFGLQQATTTATTATATKSETAAKERSGKRKGKREAKEKVKVETDGAVHLSDKVNCHVYVSGLPLVSCVLSKDL
jgi:hypothetical protein